MPHGKRATMITKRTTKHKICEKCNLKIRSENIEANEKELHKNNSLNPKVFSCRIASIISLL